MSPRARRYFGCFLPLALAVFGCGALLMLGYAAQIFLQVERVPDAGMAPLLQPGWDIVVDNTAHWTSEPARGAIVVIARPEGRLLRRLVGLPGETVDIRAGTVYVDGVPCDNRTLVAGAPCFAGNETDRVAADMAPLVLGPGQYFALSDNWAVADSRTWGALPRASIYGVAIFRRLPDWSVAPLAKLKPAFARTPTPRSGSGGTAEPASAGTPLPQGARPAQSGPAGSPRPAGLAQPDSTS